MGMFDNWSTQNMMNWSGDKANQAGSLGLGDQMRLRDNSAANTLLTGYQTPWAAQGQKGLLGATGLQAMMPGAYDVFANNWNQYASTPGGQMQNQDLQSWMNMATGQTEKDKAPNAPEALKFDPNAYASQDYTPLRKAMVHNAERSAYEAKKQAKAGGMAGSADFAANQAAIQGGLGEQTSDIANQIAGLQTQDKLNAYNQAVNEQGRQYQQDLQNWQNRLSQESNQNQGAINRLGQAASIAGSFFGPVGQAIGGGVGVGANAYSQKVGEGYNQAGQQATGNWNNYLKNQMANTYQAKTYKPQQSTPSYYGGM